MSDDALVERLRGVALKKSQGWLGVLTPEQVARGLEAMRVEVDNRAIECSDGIPVCDACWSAMVEAFLAACKEGRRGR